MGWGGVGEDRAVSGAGGPGGRTLAACHRGARVPLAGGASSLQRVLWPDPPCPQVDLGPALPCALAEWRCVTSLQLAPEPAVQTGSCSAPGPGARLAPASSRSAVAPLLLPHGVALGAESDCASHERHSR